MNVSFYTARAVADVLGVRKPMESAYERLPEEQLFFCMVDLVNSSNYRIIKGPRAGYVRGETFFALVREVVAPAAALRPFKEIGDAVLIASADGRHLLEAAVLMSCAARQLAAVAGDEAWPFAIRIGIGFGSAKRMIRQQEDFLSSAIDQLARLMGLREEGVDIVVHQDAWKLLGPVVAEYPFLRAGQANALQARLSKNAAQDIYYRPLSIDRDTVAEFTGYFVPWRDVRSGGAPATE